MTQSSELIWHNGEMIPYQQATTHVLSHALHYGSSVFEGVRAYDTPNGPAIFRLTDHLKLFMIRPRSTVWKFPLP